MGFERNDVVFKNRLDEALNEENTMGFEHNDIVTVDKMNAAIAGGGGGGSYTTASVTLSGLAPIMMPVLSDEDGDSGACTIYSEPEDGTYTIPLYNGAAHLVAMEGANMAEFSVAGDISIDMDEYLFVVTGDGTITYTAKKWTP